MNKKIQLKQKQKSSVPSLQKKTAATLTTQTDPAWTMESPHDIRLWLDKQDVMDALHCSTGTLAYWRKTGKIIYSKIGAKIYYHRSEVNRMLKNRSVQNQLMSQEGFDPDFKFEL